MKNNDPTGELRERITLLTLHCPKELTVDDCPFRMLNESESNKVQATIL